MTIAELWQLIIHWESKKTKRGRHLAKHYRWILERKENVQASNVS